MVLLTRYFFDFDVPDFLVNDGWQDVNMAAA
jgi:hypothetical protein